VNALKDSWIFPFVQSIHLIGIALLVGSIVMVDLRLLGYTLRSRSVSNIAQRFHPWTRTGLAIMLATGPILFFSDITRYAHNPAFVLKMAALALALLFQFTVHAHAERHTKIIAIISIALWTCVVLGGRAIADFDI
jgi:uncharacterized membrane protein